MKAIEGLYEAKTGTKLMQDEEDLDRENAAAGGKTRFEDLDVSSYEYKLRQKRLREGDSSAATDLLQQAKKPKRMLSDEYEEKWQKETKVKALNSRFFK